MAKTFISTKDYPVVNTVAGRLRGMKENGIYKFYGIKYADAGRFQLPVPVKPWEGIREATYYGYVSPMLSQDVPSSGELKVPHRYWPMDENCQYLNVWTKSLDRGAKKPVMFWLHGGGFSAGSSIEQQAYDGTNMAKYGDVVVVTVNHRLNILGYLDLSPFGEKYKNSGNVGHADIVMALRWVHDNIAAFGGDPENVTVFGQSGGGAKATMLLQSPIAEGLFHKVIIQSGVIGEKPTMAPERNHGKEIVIRMMAELGIHEVSLLEKVPYYELAQAYNKVVRSVRAEGYYVGCDPIEDDMYAGDPVKMGFTDYAKSIPIMVGTCLCEFSAFRTNAPENGGMSPDAARKMIADIYGDDKCDELIARFDRAYPGKRLQDLADIDLHMRNATRKYIHRRVSDRCAPTYSYVFAMDFDVDGGIGAWHCADIPYVFHNVELVPAELVGNVSERLQEEMFGAWMAFAHTGDPNHSSLPHWDVCSEGVESTMIFDRKTEQRINHDAELYKLLPESVILEPPSEAQH